MSWLSRRLAAGDREAGLTLVELLVAASMSVVLVGAAGSMLISAVRSQPQLSERSQNISTARWVLERMTREIRNGRNVYDVSASEVSFLAGVRRTECGETVEEDPAKPAISCRITYTCTTTECTRRETSLADPDGGSTTTVVGGLASSQVFNWSCDPQDACEQAGEVNFIGVTLRIPNPEGTGELTVSDGASLRTLTLTE